MKYHTPAWKECDTCPRKNNIIACTFKACEVREQKQKELIKKYKQQWTAERICFACEHCKSREVYVHSNKTTEPYCELDPDKYINGESTCNKWKPEGDSQT